MPRRASFASSSWNGSSVRFEQPPITSLTPGPKIRVHFKQRERNLTALNAELEQRVRDRTMDLEASYRKLEAAQVQLVRSEKMASLGVLVAGVAHEINNPVTFVANND